MTGSTTSGTGCASRKPATVSIRRAREEHPRLGGIDADVVEDRVELRAHELRRQLVDRRHARRVLRGQRDEHATCRDSPRPRTPSGRPGSRRRRRESDVAIVSARGTTATPFAGMTRIRFDGCDLSPARGTPVAEGSIGGMAVRDGAAWDDLLDGEEVAYARRASPPGRRADLAPLPEELHPRVRDATRHRRALHPPAAGLGRSAHAASTSSSRPAPPPARHSRSTCRCSTRSPGSEAAALSTSTPPRRSHRTSCAR